MTPLEAVTTALEAADDHSCHYGEGVPYGAMALAALAALQGLYVPPPPGSDRDALPEDLRALIAPHMRDYVSTACETALACDRASTIHHAALDMLMDWETRQHAVCRITRKQDMAKCQCDCHGEGTNQ